MEPIINISFINKQFDPECKSTDLLKNLSKNCKFFIRPSNFQELTKIFTSTFKPKDKEKQKLILSYNGILPSGDRIEIKDDKSFKKDISIIFVCYKKLKKQIGNIFDENEPDDDILGEDHLKIEDHIPNLNINEIINLKKSVSSELKIDQTKIFQNCIDNINSEFAKKLSSSVQDLILRSSQENIENNFNDLRKSFKSSKSKLFERKDSALNVIKYNNKQLNDINSTIKKAKSTKNVIPKEEKAILEPKPIPEPEKPKPKPQKEEEEKVIFKFNKGVIDIDKKISKKAKTAEIKVDNIQIKNISKKEYKSILMSWFREDKSDENINFDNNKKELDFGGDKVYSSKQDINDLNINLIVDNPIDNNDYKMFVSIINKENKKIISEKPLKIVVKIKKFLSEEDINDILNSLKNDINEFDMYLKEDDVIKIIKEKKGEENEIKKVVIKKLEKQKKENKERLEKEEKERLKREEKEKLKKIEKEKKEEKERLERLEREKKEKEKRVKDLSAKLENETNYTEFLNKNEVEEKILSFNFNEEEIKKWIEEKRPRPVPEPAPAPVPERPEVNEELIREITDELEEELYVSSFIPEEDLRQIIIDNRYDRNEITICIKKRM